MYFQKNTIFTEIKLPESVEEKRKLLSKYDGRFVLVKDNEDCDPLYRLIKLNYSGEDSQVYHIINRNTANYRNLHIHDLIGLLVQTN